MIPFPATAHGMIGKAPLFIGSEDKGYGEKGTLGENLRFQAQRLD
jgi:hypothetical protein